MRRNVPAEEPEREFTREGVDVNWFDEGKDTLTRRVKQIRTGVHWAEQPPSRICHMVSNVQLLGRHPTARRPPRSPSRAGFSSTAIASRRRPTSWSASARTCLRRVDGAWRIARRKIILDQSVLLVKNLTFFF
jgi:3-phenylpropionate/cinnamic acid dioxygenase small subunit